MPATPEERVAQTFNDHFGGFGVMIGPSDVVPTGPRRITDDRSGWAIRYRVDLVDDEPMLELYAVNRWTNDRHGRIHPDGRFEHLVAIEETFVTDPTNPIAAVDFRARNEAVAAQLSERGLH